MSIVDWSQIPDWAMWVAREANGELWAFAEEPSYQTANAGWHNYDAFGKIPKHMRLSRAYDPHYAQDPILERRPRIH